MNIAERAARREGQVEPGNAMMRFNRLNQSGATDRLPPDLLSPDGWRSGPGDLGVGLIWQRPVPF